MNAIGKLLSTLGQDIPAAIVVVIHLPDEEDSDIFVSRLQKQTTLHCQAAANEMPLRQGVVYFAPAGRHLLIKKDRILLGNGPAEGRWRPSIDTTMRSAAAAWDSHAIGIILTGMLDDGTVGMEAIQRCGGYTMVQDPDEAEYPEMPLSVKRNIEVDYTGSLLDLSKALLQQLKKNPARSAIPEEIRLEAEITENVATDIDSIAGLGDKSFYSCPACGGGLWEIKNGHVHRYRCHSGHTYTEHQLYLEKSIEIEKSLWIALRTLEEKRQLLTRIAIREEEQGLTTLSSDHYARAAEIARHIDILKKVIFSEYPKTTPESQKAI
jgi:two-component system chemotaxis response regulator CheB